MPAWIAFVRRAAAKSLRCAVRNSCGRRQLLLPPTGKSNCRRSLVFCTPRKTDKRSSVNALGKNRRNIAALCGNERGRRTQNINQALICIDHRCQVVELRAIGEERFQFDAETNSLLECDVSSHQYLVVAVGARASRQRAAANSVPIPAYPASVPTPLWSLCQAWSTRLAG
jgi:hypothetical protein